jgi:hypothetical protein
MEEQMGSRTLGPLSRATAVSIVALSLVSAANAAVSTGAGGQGVRVGQSGLIRQYDYADPFTGSADGGVNPNRPYVPAVQSAAAYAIEQTFGHPATNFHSPNQGAGVAEFSFASDTQGRVGGESPAYPGASGAGSDTGFTQTGGNVDYSVPFGVRTRYLVQADAVTSGDRIDVTSGPAQEGIFQPNSLSIFFRATGGLSLYNGSTDNPVPGFDTGLRGGGQWHNYAVLFDQDAKTLEMFVDEQSRGTIDLTTFAGGLYQNFSNAAVGVGGGLGNGENRIWTDNFQTGGVAAPEPTSLALAGVAALGILARRRNR